MKNLRRWSINNVRTKLDNEFCCVMGYFFGYKFVDLYTFTAKYLGIISLAQTNKGTNRYSKIILKMKIVSFNANNKTKLINSEYVFNKKF